MKAHQRIIRENKEEALRDDSGLFSSYPKKTDIKQAVLKEITYSQAKRIILEYEWLGTMGTTQLHYGIFYDGLLSGVVCFGYFQAMNTNSGGHPYAPYVGEKYSQMGIQLSRGACAWWSHEHSGSKLIAYGLREMSKKGYKYVVAFSDPEAGEIGTLYQATNWYYLGFSETIHYDIYNSDGTLFKNDRDFFKEYGYSGKKKMQEFIDSNPTKKYELRERRPKARYIKLIGNKKENKEMFVYLKDKIQPYPKRDV